MTPSNKLQWFRLYHRIIDDEKIRLLAFEDRWHFVAICCLKADGLLDEPASSLRDRKIAVKLGVQARELDEIRRRLSEVGLVDDDMQPTAWDELQYRSDTSTDRVRKYREKTKAERCETVGNVSVTPQETDTESDSSSLRSEPFEKKREDGFEDWFSSWPSMASDDIEASAKAFAALPKPDQAKAIASTPAYLKAATGGGRTMVVSSTKYLTKRLWERVDKARASPQPALQAIAGKAQSREEYIAAELRRSQRSFQ